MLVIDLTKQARNRNEDGSGEKAENFDKLYSMLTGGSDILSVPPPFWRAEH